MGGVYPVPSTVLEEDPSTAKRAPEATVWLEWVVLGAGRTECSAAGTALVPPCGPGRSCPAGPPCTRTLQMPPLGQKGRDFSHFTVKLVKTRKCHQKVSIRPLIVPIYKTGSKCHLLKF